MLLGNVIKQSRIDHNLNQSQLAANICTQAIISKIENQNYTPSIEVLISICQKLSLTLNDVFSEFSDLPSANLVTDKIAQIDTMIQENNISDAQPIIESVAESSLSSNQIGHLHYLKARLAHINNDNNEAIFQYNFVIQTLNNRKQSFWKILSFVGIADIYNGNHDFEKANYYYELAFQNFNTANTKLFSPYFYVLESLDKLARYFVKQKKYHECEMLVKHGLTLHDGFLSSKFTDDFYYLSAVVTLNSEEKDNSTVSHDLTMAIAFADFNDNDELLSQINQLMDNNNIRELKIKP